MIIEREINGIGIAVDSSKPNEIFFESSFVLEHPEVQRNLTTIEICNILSGSTYTPLLLTWELLDKCSFKCPFCYIVGHSNNKITRFKNSKKHIAELIDLGLLYCTLTGG